MKKEFLLPDLGEGLTEAEIVQWMVKPGDTVALNQTLAEVETAKAVVELPSPYEGSVHALHAEPGQTVDVGAPLIEFIVPDAAADSPSDTTSDGQADGEEQAQPNLVGYGAAPTSGKRPARRQKRSAPAQPAADPVLTAAPHDAVVSIEPEELPADRPRSTPPVRKYAKDHGVDLALVAAEVGDRVIAREDVDAYRKKIGERAAAANATPSAPSAAQPHTRTVGERKTTRVPIRGVRRHTADAMVRSAFTAPHASLFHTVDVTAMSEFVAALRADKAWGEHRIGPLAVVAKAVCLALPQHPGVNGFWDDTAGEIVENHFVDLGIAAATDRGLVVPIIRNAETMNLRELSDAIRQLAATARQGKTAPADMQGGNFSITNIGIFGVDTGTPILPPGQSGILGVGAVRKQPWEYRGEIALRDVMTLSLSFDHRLVDGSEGASFLLAVAQMLENPARAMLY
ncbi:dihydrolipoamide acetyltransferase family protein [Microbacterium sp. YY-01]|uniref:dihydrolipoamide acetyltransferase family protein n=1 Tax=Microbacterium sp. YY-01 TaxID=3421634 RepID=UPI003D169343